MTPDNWATIAVAFLGLFGLVYTNVYTVRSGNKREITTQKEQQKHEELMKVREQEHAETMKVREHEYAERARLAGQKHAAYSKLLVQIPIAAVEKKQAFADAIRDQSNDTTFNPVALDAAASQAKLVSSPSGREEIGEALNTYRTYHYADPTVPEKRLQEIFANELVRLDSTG
jgi:hypothetical protein